jgi:hypothetical protein
MIEDSTVADPDGHQVTFENERIRVIEGRFAEGATSPMHSHPDRIIISLSSYRLKSIDPDGNETILDLRPGQVVWSDALAHATEVIAGSGHVIDVEIK